MTASIVANINQAQYKISASILSADFARLGAEATNVLYAGADEIHFDVMDNHYVPNLTVGPVVCAALRSYGVTAPIDVHLMTSPVDDLITAFAKAGASAITFHPEASAHIDRSLQLIRSYGCRAGLAFNPATPLDYLDYVWDKLDLVLIMSVNPGFGGQEFIPSALDKIAALRTKIDAVCALLPRSQPQLQPQPRQLQLQLQKRHRVISLAVDGGVKLNNIAAIAAAGADTFVVGSTIFNSASNADAKVNVRSNKDEDDIYVPILTRLRENLHAVL